MPDDAYPLPFTGTPPQSTAPAPAPAPAPAAPLDVAALDDAALIARYDARIPRYTSYPTAVQFHPGVTEATLRGWLAGLPATAPVSLYLHVPFCRVLCWYCGCHTTAVTGAAVARSDGPVAQYVETLLAEAALWAGALGRRQPVTHLHWGGGTPSIVGPERWRRLMAGLADRFAFAPGAQIAAELDPRTLDAEMIAALAETGVNRVSLGVQDFDARVQMAVNRVQPYELVAAKVAALRAAGVGGLNLDLMYGLPHQSVASVVDTAEKALALNPDRIALFGYAHVPWMKKHQTLLPEAALPGPAERLAQFRAAAHLFERAGLVAIGLDHFARPEDPLARAAAEGRLRRNFQGYTDDPAPVLFGLGASSISALPQGFAQNAAAVPAWREAVAAGRFAIARGVAITPEDRLRADLIERLMCDLALDIAARCRLAGADPQRFAGLLPALDAMAADGLLERQGWRIRMSRRGRPFVRGAAALFDAYLDAAGTRHARAV
ncbi:MAG: oxygen-independent coproporphyrinogen III oxidase [Alphaproteobacteria bacterium]|nr:oxygen-independent coproporphyrinogen III oxidase [Alphaproteobacteria bacterium]